MGMYDREWYRADAASRTVRAHRTTSVVKTLIIINVVCFFLRTQVDLSAFALFPRLVVEKFWIWQILTSVFLHGSTTHLLLNMLVLWMFGQAVEQRLGPRVFLRFYLGGGVVAGIAYVAMAYVTRDFRPAVGASGAIMGVLVYFTFLAPHHTVYLFFILPMKMMHATLLFVGWDLYYFVFSGARDTGVAHTAHLGGALFGYLYWKFAHRIDRFFLERRIRIPKKPARGEADQAEVDRLLQKIYEEGMSSLTQKERDFLKHASDRMRGK